MPQFNIEQARFNMVEQQVRPWEVLDPQVLDLLLTIPRENFVPDGYQQLAFADISIPLGHGEFMLPPRMEGRILQALALKPSDQVLEVGTGSGYLTALLAKSAQHVVSVDRESEFTQHARTCLAQAGIDNVSLKTGDAVHGWKEDAPYDAIVVTGSVPVLPPEYAQQLNLGGRLFVVTGEAPLMQACLITRVDTQEWQREVLFETELPALRNAPPAQHFVF